MNTLSKNAESNNLVKPLLSSRLLKFRAWNIPNKLMYQNVQDGLLAENEKGRLILGLSLGKLSRDAGSVVMQFTGLIDKNGIEIFEGDIVKADWHWEYGKIVDLSYQGLFFYEISEYALEDALEVIGNIFENAELL